MNRSRKILIFGGIALAAFGMFYGLYYAVFTEHQTLDQMGGSLAAAFAHVAAREMPAAHTAVVAYGDTKYDYVRQVDVHSHWIGLAMVMIVLGMVFDHVTLGENLRRILAWALLLGSILFPLGVILQTVTRGGTVSSGLAILGSVLVIGSLGLAAIGFMRQSPRSV
ncbi:MAG TPA: hypothetical protein VFI95_17485 [Terriglobales bacterium]|nr:hypothetical protein [Terriglobales bacterium]